MNHRRVLILVIALLMVGGLAFWPTTNPYADGEVLVGAGDIASCGSEGDELTANLLDNIDGVVFTAGDTSQADGTPQFWQECYEPSWGRHKARTRPAIGNHEYQGVPSPKAYYDYFGENAGPPMLGYYSYNLGSWHIIVLNSMLPIGKGTPQEQWLRADLAANPTACTLAIWHHPIYSSGRYGYTTRMRQAWNLLYAAGADVVINGDAHHYERFAPMDPRGRIDREHGIRQFIVGTGGGYLTPLGKAWPATEARQNEAWGVLKMTLGNGGYSWEFIPVVGRSYTDSGSAACVGPRQQ